jgi:hypothetical protein
MAVARGQSAADFLEQQDVGAGGEFAQVFDDPVEVGSAVG